MLHFCPSSPHNVQTYLNQIENPDVPKNFLQFLDSQPSVDLDSKYSPQHNNQGGGGLPNHHKKSLSCDHKCKSKPLLMKKIQLREETKELSTSTAKPRELVVTPLHSFRKTKAQGFLSPMQRLANKWNPEEKQGDFNTQKRLLLDKLAKSTQFHHPHRKMYRYELGYQKELLKEQIKQKVKQQNEDTEKLLQLQI